MARTFNAAGLRENEVISVLCENRHAYNAITFGALLLNAIVAPINVTYTERKIIQSVAIVSWLLITVFGKSFTRGAEARTRPFETKTGFNDNDCGGENCCSLQKSELCSKRDSD